MLRLGVPTRTVVTALVCVKCGEDYHHVEVMPADDEPFGLPRLLRCGECAGRLEVAAPAGTLGTIEL